jgi:DNA-binding Lrp family transcriptional regulator
MHNRILYCFREIYQMQRYRIDEWDIYILRILGRNCGAPFRNIGLDFGITIDIVKNRIEILIYGYYIKGLFT